MNTTPVTFHESIIAYLDSHWPEDQRVNNTGYVDAKSRFGALLRSVPDRPLVGMGIDEAVDVVQQFVDYRKVMKLSGTTIDNDRRVLSGLFSWLCQRRLVEFRGRPTDRRWLQLPPKVHVRKRPMSDDEVRAMLEHTREHWIYPYVVLEIGCGLRPRGAARLKWTDFDWDSRQIRVTEKRRERLVPMSDWVCAEIQGWRTKHMWRTPHPNTVSKTFAKIRNKLELPKQVTLQAARRSFVKKLWEANVSPQLAAAICGHSVAVAEKHYASLDATNAHATVNLVNFFK
jgi:integrase